MSRSRGGYYRSERSMRMETKPQAKFALGGRRPDRPLNNSKGCGTVMRTVPIGWFLQWATKEAFEIGMRASAITHNHPTGIIVGGAKRLANKHDQIAHFDLKNFTSVTVNRNATSGGVVKGNNYGQTSYSFNAGFGGFHRDGERTIATIFQPYRAQAYSGGIGGSTPATPDFVTILQSKAQSKDDCKAVVVLDKQENVDGLV